MMKSDARQLYTTALVEHARRTTIGTVWPVVVQVFRFFSVACEHADLPHPFMTGDCRRILEQFDEGFRQGCFANVGEGFPVHVMTVGKAILQVCPHGKQAMIDAENRTPEKYARAATISGNNPKECWALFGPNAVRQHPMIAATFSTERKRLQSATNGYIQRTAWVDDDKIKLEGTKLIGSN